MRMLQVILLHIENIDLYPFFVCYLTVIKSDTPPGSITINIAMVSTSCHFIHSTPCLRIYWSHSVRLFVHMSVNVFVLWLQTYICHLMNFDTVYQTNKNIAKCGNMINIIGRCASAIFIWVKQNWMVNGSFSLVFILHITDDN